MQCKMCSVIKGKPLVSIEFECHRRDVSKLIYILQITPYESFDFKEPVAVVIQGNISSCFVPQTTCIV